MLVAMYTPAARLFGSLWILAIFTMCQWLSKNAHQYLISPFFNLMRSVALFYRHAHVVNQVGRLVVPVVLVRHIRHQIAAPVTLDYVNLPCPDVCLVARLELNFHLIEPLNESRPEDFENLPVTTAAT